METLLTKIGFPKEYQHIGFEFLALGIVLTFPLLIRNKVFSGLLSLIINFWRGILESIMEKDEAHKHLPLIFSIFIFILVMNIMGLIPGFSPPTMNINTNLGIAVFVFLYYNFQGIRKHGIKYLKHFFGPFLPIAIIYFPIEVLSHLFRILSLSIRLYGNMQGDHAVLEIFTHLTYLIVPVAFMVLGLIVSVVQAFVFAILTAVYISLAVSEEEH